MLYMALDLAHPCEPNEIQVAWKVGYLLTEWLLAYQGGLCSMALVGQYKLLQ
jgi:hypothetical protein